MKVGKEIRFIVLPVVTIIYAVGMQMISVYRFGKSCEDYEKDVQDALTDYEDSRKQRAKIYGEVE